MAKCNVELVQETGTGKPHSDVTAAYDAEFGTYKYGDRGKDASGAHPTTGGPGPLANVKSPFALK